ncbi:MAG: SpoIIE family protein phosphatase [Candidatus Riflebacteria bacterium]|nr:SpoIIE family protein phosphatase [Candidatus Riflebacteria bacterium]
MSYMESFPFILCIVAMCTHVILGLLVLFRSPKKPSNQLFALILFLFFLWSLAEAIVLSNGISLLTLSLLFTPPILLSYFFCVFSAIFPRKMLQSFVISSFRNRILLLLPAILLCTLLWSGNLIKSLILVSNGFFFSLGSFEIPAKAIIIVYLIVTLKTYSDSWKKLDSEFQRQRLKYAFSGLMLPAAAGSLFLALGRMLGVSGMPTFYTYGLFPGLSIAMAALIGYSILRYKLMDIDLVCTIGLIYTILSLVLAAGLELLENFLQNYFNVTGNFAVVLSTLVIAASFGPIKSLIGTLVDMIFGMKSFDPHVVLRHLFREMRNSKTPEQVCFALLSELKNVIEFSFAVIILPTRNIFFVKPLDMKLSSVTCPSKWLDLNDLEAIVEAGLEIPSFEIKPFLDFQEKGFRFVFPIPSSSGNQIDGGFFLGPKASKLPYSDQEEALLISICQEISPILDNIALVNELVFRESARKELQTAMDVYSRLKNDASKNRWNGRNIRVFSSLSEKIKGDFIDINDSEGQKYIAVCDAFHEGVVAAITLHGIYCSLRTAESFDRLEKLNSVLHGFSNPPLCAAISLIEEKGKALKIINTGNPAPILISGKKLPRFYKESSKPVGLEEKLSSEIFEIEIGKNEFLFVYTNGARRIFGDPIGDNLRNLIKTIPGEKLEFETFFQYISDKINSLISSNNFFNDDISFVLIGGKSANGN